MKRMVTTCCVVLGLLAASSALALDINQQRTPLAPSLRGTHPFTSTAVLGCDDGYDFNAFYQYPDRRYGNLFNFAPGSVLSTLSFAHYGYGFAGPYAYDLEIWDAASCTMVGGKVGLSAADAAFATTYESVDLCSSGIVVSGNMLIMIKPISCAAPTDCYPDIMFDDQIGVLCPVIITTATTTPVCNDISSQAGPFLLRVDTNGCQTPARQDSWGHLKSIYR